MPKITHRHLFGGKESPTYRSWHAMITRTTNPRYHRIADYAGRGITIEDPRWLKFDNFLADMGIRPEGTTLGRKDNDKGYSKRNCRWETKPQQYSNRRTSVLLTFKGETHTISEWSRITGINHRTIGARLKNGYSIEDVLSNNSFKKGNVPYDILS